MAGSLRISQLTFRAGRAAGDEPLGIAPSNVVVLVGPNNSGKSLALREIEDWCFGQNKVTKVVGAVELDFPDQPDSAIQLLKAFETDPPPDRGPAPDTLWIGQPIFREGEAARYLAINTNDLRNAVTDRSEGNLRLWLTASYTVRLDGRTRFSLADPKPTGDLQQHPQNHLWALFRDDAARARVRKLTEEAFGLHFVIDPTGMRNFRIRMSTRAPKSKAEEQALDAGARAFHHAAEPIQELSDGVQAFVGLVSAVMSLPHKVILIDEPEAFLHPPLARRLGKNLAALSSERDASLIVGTHSSEFLVGCIEAADTSVVRLTYEKGAASARNLDALEVAVMTQDPLLRSTGVLDALFHRAAVVTEADGDRAFYDEINRRLQLEGRGIRDAVFLNAQNMQTIRRLVAPLRRIGIPAAAVVDLDLIDEGGASWEETLTACQVPQAGRPVLETERAYLSGSFTGINRSAGRMAMKSRGLRALNGDSLRRGRALLQELGRYGLFLVPMGELESWLPQIGARGHGSDWVVDAFNHMGRAPTDANYLTPASGDVWAFLDTIAGWVDDPSRLGTT